MGASDTSLCFSLKFVCIVCEGGGWRVVAVEMALLLGLIKKQS